MLRILREPFVFPINLVKVAKSSPLAFIKERISRFGKKIWFNISISYSPCDSYHNQILQSIFNSVKLIKDVIVSAGKQIQSINLRILKDRERHSIVFLLRKW